MPLTPEEIAELTADPSPLNPVPTQMYQEAAGPAGKYVDPFAQSAPLLQRLGTALPMATIGFGAPTMLGRAALNAGVGAGSELLKGSSPEEAAKTGGLMAVVGAGGEKVGQFLRYLGSAIPKKAFDAAQEAKVGEWLKANVPWWKDMSVPEMSTTTKALKVLQEGYSDAFAAARDKIPEDAVASIPVTLANKLGIKGESSSLFPLTEAAKAAFAGGAKQQGRDPAAILAAMENVNVNARQLLDKMPGSEGGLRAGILKGLDSIGADLIPEARNAYRNGMGWIEFANRGGIGKPGRFDAQTAQAALLKPAGDKSLAQKALGRRDMGDLESVVQGPLKEPISSFTPNSLAWHLGLGAGGALGGLGLHGMHGLAGILAGAIPRPTLYRNVPPMYPQAGPLAQQGLRAVMPGFLGNMPSQE